MAYRPLRFETYSLVSRIVKVTQKKKKEEKIGNISANALNNVGNYSRLRRTKEESLCRTSARPPVRPHRRHTNIKEKTINGYGNPNAMEENLMAARTFREEKKNNKKVVSFLTLFLMFTVTWMTEEGLKRVKTKETNFIGRKT